jgi:hypothetical protein
MEVDQGQNWAVAPKGKNIIVYLTTLSLAQAIGVSK